MKLSAPLPLSIIVLGLASWVVGCGDERTTAEIRTPIQTSDDLGKSDIVSDTEMPPDGVETPATPPSPPPPVLARYYGIDVSSWLLVSDGPDDENPDEWTASMSGLARTVVGDDGQLQLEVSPCRVELPEIDGREVELKSGGLQGAQPALLDLNWSTRDDNLYLQSGQGAMVAGAELTQPVMDDMPTSKRDSRVTDHDHDRRPGITLKVEGFSAYIAIRYTMAIQGLATTSGLISGSASIRVELAVFGDNVPFFDVRKAFDRALGKLHLDDEKHEFILTPLDIEQANCESVNHWAQ